MCKGNKVVQNRTGVFSEIKGMPSDIAMMFEQSMLDEEWIQKTYLQWWMKNQIVCPLIHLDISFNKFKVGFQRKENDNKIKINWHFK